MNNAMNNAIKNANNTYEDDNFIIKGSDDVKRHLDRLRAETAKRHGTPVGESNMKQRYPKAFKVALVKAISDHVVSVKEVIKAGLNSSTIHNWQKSFKALTGTPLRTNMKFPIPKTNPLDKRISFFNSEIERLQKKVHALGKIRELGLTEAELKDVLGFAPELSEIK